MGVVVVVSFARGAISPMENLLHIRLGAGGAAKSRFSPIPTGSETSSYWMRH
jgi:hypothetical protein